MLSGWHFHSELLPDLSVHTCCFVSSGIWASLSDAVNTMLYMLTCSREYTHNPVSTVQVTLRGKKCSVHWILVFCGWIYYLYPLPNICCAAKTILIVGGLYEGVWFYWALTGVLWAVGWVPCSSGLLHCIWWLLDQTAMWRVWSRNLCPAGMRRIFMGLLECACFATMFAWVVRVKVTSIFIPVLKVFQRNIVLKQDYQLYTCPLVSSFTFMAACLFW